MLAAVLLLACTSSGAADDDVGAGESSETGVDASDSTSSGESSSATGESSSETGEPDCLAPMPCPACTCEAGEWSCACTTYAPAATFIDVPAHHYALVAPTRELVPLETTGHRQFVAFAPSEHDPESDPIFVFFNGGPAVSSAMLLGLNIGPQTFAPAATAGAELADNPHRWTRLGNLLWIDARQVGFSYSLLDEPGDAQARADALDFASFNAYVDAGEFVRVLLDVLGHHEGLRDNPIVLVGESYGATRAQLMLDMLLEPDAYAGGERKLIDAELVERIRAHHQLVQGSADATPEQIAAQFGRQILIQPPTGGTLLEYFAGQRFEQPGSPVEQLAGELGLDFVPCSEKPLPCNAYDNAIVFVGTAGRSAYDTAAPASWLDDLFALVTARCSERAVLEALLGVPLDAIPELLPDARASEAWRIVDPLDYPSDAALGDLADQLGPLAPWDRYFLVFEYGALGQYRGLAAQQLDLAPDDPHYGELLLHNLAHVDTLITSASRDLVVYTPALADTLASYGAIVEQVEVVGETWTIHYRADAFADLPGLAARSVSVPSYDASHAVSMDAPAELFADVEAWLGD